MKIRVCRSAVLLWTVCLVSIASAQVNWWRTFGDSMADNGYAVRQTADGGYIIAGSTASFGAGITDVYLIKTDTAGYPVWTRTCGDTMEDGSNSVWQTADSGYVVAGYTGSYGAGGHDVWLVKTDAQGDTAWTRTYGGARGDQGNSVRQTGDGGYIIAGYTWSFGAGNGDVYLVKTNASGDTLWTRAYGGADDDEGYSVQPTADGGYVIAGATRSFGAGVADVYLIRTNASGDTLWTRTYGGTSNDEGYSVQQTADSGYIIVGYTSSFGAGNQDVYLVRTNASGDTLWTRTYGGRYRDWGNSVQPLAGGGYIVAGVTRSFGAGGEDVYLVRTNASGDTLWTRTCGGTVSDEGCSVQPTTDGGYIIAGSTNSFGAGSDDVYLVKTDADGYVGLTGEINRPQAVGRRPIAVVELSLPPGAVAFDAMGRCATHARSGVYFLREGPRLPSRGFQSVRKVVVTR